MLLVGIMAVARGAKKTENTNSVTSIHLKIKRIIGHFKSVRGGDSPAPNDNIERGRNHANKDTH